MVNECLVLIYKKKVFQIKIIGLESFKNNEHKVLYKYEF